MKLIKNMCLVVFAIIIILFTVGYASQPIVSSGSTNIIASPGSNQNNVYDKTFYITHYINTSGNISNSYTQSTNYTDLNNDLQILFVTVFYMCIAITVFLTVEILLAVIGLKFISKIVFLLVLIIMIITFLIIQVAILTNQFVVMAENKNATKPTVSNGTGYYLILIATCLMFVNYIIYLILA